MPYIQEVKKEKHKGSLILKIALFALFVYIVSSLIAQQMQISEKREQLATLQNQIAEQRLRNDVAAYEAQNRGSDTAAYVEYVVREELDYARLGERVFVYVAGN